MLEYCSRNGQHLRYCCCIIKCCLFHSHPGQHLTNWGYLFKCCPILFTSINYKSNNYTTKNENQTNTNKFNPEPVDYLHLTNPMMIKDRPEFQLHYLDLDYLDYLDYLYPRRTSGDNNGNMTSSYRPFFLIVLPFACEMLVHPLV